MQERKCGGTNYPSLLPVWVESQACGQFHVSLSLICGWSCLIILGWSFDCNSIWFFREGAIEPACHWLRSGHMITLQKLKSNTAQDTFISISTAKCVMKECDHPGILNSLSIKSNQMLFVFLILRVSFSFRESTFVFDVFIVALSCFHVPPLALLMHPEPFAQFSLQPKCYFSQWTNSWSELWKPSRATIHVSLYCSWHNRLKDSFDK